MVPDIVGSQEAAVPSAVVRAARLVDPEQVESLKTQALALAASVSDPDLNGMFSVAFDTVKPVGVPLVVRNPEPPEMPGPFLPLIRGGRVITASLGSPAGPLARATAVIRSDAQGKPVVMTIYPGEPMERLTEFGYELALAPDGAEAQALIEEFGHFLLRRLRPLHQAMECLGVATQQPGPPFRLVSLGGKAVTVALKDQRDGGDFSLDIVRAGNVFAARRRYDPDLSKLGLADSEILQSGIVSIGFKTGRLDVTFMSSDARPAHLVVNRDSDEPSFDQNIPDSAIAAMRNRAEDVSLGAAVARAVTEIKAKGLARSALVRLWSASARRAYADQKAILGYLGQDCSVGVEARYWAEEPERMHGVVKAAARYLDIPEEGQTPLIRLLLASAIGQLLAVRAAS